MAAETITYLGTEIGQDSSQERIISRIKTLVLYTDNTADAGNTLSVDLAVYGGTLLQGVLGFVQTTDNSVIATENPTSSVTGTTVTLTIPAGTDNDPRAYVLFYQ